MVTIDSLYELTNALSNGTIAAPLYDNNNNNSHDNVYGAVIVAVHCHCESSPGSSDECSMQRQVAANL